ncbi:MAG: type II secretion system protein [bacterium]|nr:type II secretion system protein [bacterium]
MLKKFLSNDKFGARVLRSCRHKFKSTSQPALTLIEMLIAVALISVLLTALALTLLYSNRTIQEAQIKSTAVNQAQSCLDNFRNLRDSNTWPAFCSRLADNAAGVSKFTSGDTVIYQSSDAGATALTICPLVVGNRYNLEIEKCDNASGVEKATVKVTVTYDTFSGGSGTTVASQTFQKTAIESNYIFER